MRRFLIWVALIIAVSTLTVLATMAPTMVLGGMGAVLGLCIFLVIPKDRVAGISGSAALALLLLVPVQNIGQYGPLKYIVLAVVAALTLGVLARRMPSIHKRPPGLWIFVAYFAVIAFATPRSMEPSAWALLQGVFVAGLGTAIMFALMNPNERRGSTKFLVAFAIGQAIYALVELLVGLPPLWGFASVNASGDPNLMYNQIFSGLIRSQGTFSHPLPLALLLLVGLALVIRGHGPKTLVARIATVSVLFAGCFAAGSRSALAVAALFVLLGVGHKRWKGLVVGGTLLVIGWLSAVAAGFLKSDVYERFLEGDSLSHRSGALNAIPGLLANQDPVNTMLGNGYFSAYELFREGLLQVGNFFAIDNQFVMTLVEGGIIGLTVLLLLVALALVKIDRTERLGLLSIVVFFLSFDVLSWPSGIALFGAFVGLAFSAPTVSSQPLEGTSVLEPAKGPMSLLASPFHL